MPLSEHEQRSARADGTGAVCRGPEVRLLPARTDPRSNFRRRVLLAGTAFVSGVVLLMLGLVTQLIVVSIVGFVLMLASAFFAVTSYRAVTAAAQLGVVDPSGVRRPAATSGGGRRQRGAASGPGFMARMEERWNRRRDENGR